MALTISVVVAASYAACGSSSKASGASACTCVDPLNQSLCTDSGAYECSPPCGEGSVCVAYESDSGGGGNCLPADGGGNAGAWMLGNCTPNDCACFAQNGPSSDCTCQCTAQGAMVVCIQF